MTDDHATEAQKKKEEAAKRLQEALARKQGGAQQRPGHDQHAQNKGGGTGAFAPKLFRRGPRGG